MSTSALNRLLTVLAWAGVYVAGSLTIAHIYKLKLPCGGASGCDRLAASTASEWFGQPVALYGLIAYVLFAALAGFLPIAQPAARRKIATVGMLLAIVGAGASMYLTYVAIGMLRITCWWCLSSFAIMLATLFTYGALLGRDLSDIRRSRFDETLFFAGMVLAVGGVGIWASQLNRAVSGRATVQPGINSVSDLIERDAYFIGPQDAPVTLVEYADFYCPACRSIFPTVESLMQRAGGKLRLGFRCLPLYRITGHELGLPAAMMLEYAADQGKYWSVIEQMFKTPVEKLRTVSGVVAAGGRAGLDPMKAEQALSQLSGKYFDRVREGVSRALALGINQTPTFVIFAKGQKPRAAGTQDLEQVLTSPPYGPLLGLSP